MEIAYRKEQKPTGKEGIYVADEFLCRLPGLLIRSTCTSLCRRSTCYPVRREIGRLRQEISRKNGHAAHYLHRGEARYIALELCGASHESGLGQRTKDEKAVRMQMWF